MKLNVNKLDEVYIAWTKRYGIGRNEEDLRFGQWVSNNFDLTGLTYDPFYEENANIAYKVLREGF